LTQPAEIHKIGKNIESGVAIMTKVQKFTNGETVNLEKLSIQELYKLHYEEESYIASATQQLPPFSNERYELLSEGYQFVTKLMACRHKKEFGETPQIWGANRGTAKALIRLIKKKIADNPEKTAPVFYEIGVGLGFALGKVLEKFGASELHVSGCDINLSQPASELSEKYPHINLTEGNAYECIQKIPDNSIDFLYSDNVFEHFFPDEAHVIYDELMKKLKPNALLFLIIPNRHIGPGDISKFFLPMGAKATGFHLMEMSFNEVTNALKPYNVRHLHCCWYIPKVQKYILLRCRLLIALKLRLENLLAKIPFNRLKNFLFYSGGYSISVMKKH